MKLAIVITTTLLFGTSSCEQPPSTSALGNTPSQLGQQTGILINATGKTIQTRFLTPQGFERKQVKANSFAEYLRNLPLKPVGSKVKYYHGAVKDTPNVYEAVVDMDLSKRDLQQCADAIMRLRGEYFYGQKLYDSISFTLTNGFEVPYSKWMNGYRVEVNGNKTAWVKTAEPDSSYTEFRNYMEFIFTYAGTLSLSKELKTRKIKDMHIGDVFIRGGSPGHAVIVVDMAENDIGEKVFLLAQSYMPAQETQILKNPNDLDLSPWYHAENDKQLFTPEWKFTVEQLKTW